jgi:GNAT superfamily N-acetyltransferase
VPDLLVKLYELPAASPDVERLASEGVICRRAETFERRRILDFVDQRWPRWTDEVAAAFHAVPPTLFLAATGTEPIGFAAYNATRPNYFGPTAVRNDQRKRGVGTALLWLALDALRGEGYAYAIIGGAGPTAFYERTVGAMVIPDSEGGIYEAKFLG